MSDPQIEVPWTADQVASLNGYQQSGVFHPFTGTNDLLPAGEDDVLVAREDGWHSTVDASYRQTWAWAWMADWSWRQLNVFGKGATDVAQLPGHPADGALEQTALADSRPRHILDNDTLTTFRLADDELIWGDFDWVVHEEFFEELDEPIDVIKEVWTKQSAETVTFKPSHWDDEDESIDESE